MMKSKIGLIFPGIMMLTACMTPAPDATSIPSKRALRTMGAFDVLQHSEQQLTPWVSHALDDALSRGDGGYGAFYIRPDGGAWAVVTGRYSAEDARQMAKIDCDIASGENCILYATFVPRSEPSEHTLPNTHQGVLTSAKAETASGHYLAVANNAAGYTGFGVNYLTVAEAEAGAINACEESTRTGLANEEHRFISAYETAGLLDCEIFGVYR